MQNIGMYKLRCKIEVKPNDKMKNKRDGRKRLKVYSDIGVISQELTILNNIEVRRRISTKIQNLLSQVEFWGKVLEKI